MAWIAPQPGERPSNGRPTEDDESAADDVSEERPIDRFRRGAVGSVVAAGLLGLRDALEGRPDRDEIPITSEAPGADGHGLEVHLDLDHPERSVAIVRPPEPPA